MNTANNWTSTKTNDWVINWIYEGLLSIRTKLSQWKVMNRGLKGIFRKIFNVKGWRILCLRACYREGVRHVIITEKVKLSIDPSLTPFFYLVKPKLLALPPLPPKKSAKIALWARPKLRRHAYDSTFLVKRSYFSFIVLEWWAIW